MPKYVVTFAILAVLAIGMVATAYMNKKKGNNYV